MRSKGCGNLSTPFNFLFWWKIKIGCLGCFSGRTWTWNPHASSLDWLRLQTHITKPSLNTNSSSYLRLPNDCYDRHAPVTAHSPERLSVWMVRTDTTLIWKCRSSHSPAVTGTKTSASNRSECLFPGLSVPDRSVFNSRQGDVWKLAPYKEICSLLAVTQS